MPLLGSQRVLVAGGVAEGTEHSTENARKHLYIRCKNQVYCSELKVTEACERI